VQYMLLIYSPHQDDTVTAQQREATFIEYVAYTQELAATGKLIASDPLQPTSTATSVRVRDGRRRATDGPFAETKEWLAGYYAIDCDTLEEAIDWAAKIPGAKDGTIEVRPLMAVPGRPVPTGARLN
jgi:hypothetical protein